MLSRAVTPPRSGGGPAYLSFTAGSVPSSITCTRATTKWLPNASQVLTQIAVNTLGLGYDTGDSKWRAVIEPAATNYATYSQDASQWTAGGGALNVSVTADTAVAPDGSTTADLITVSATAATRVRHDMTGAGSTDGNVWSIYVKQASGGGATDFNYFLIGGFTAGNLAQFTIDYSTGVLTQVLGTSAYTVDAGNGWWRIVVPLTGLIANENIYAYLGALSGSGLVPGTTLTAGEKALRWGLQCERGTVPTSYIPTTTATVTRAADAATYAVTSLPLVGTLGAAGKGVANTSGYGVLATLSDGTTSNVVSVYYFGGNTILGDMARAGVAQASFSEAVTVTDANAIAVAFSSNDTGCAINGTSEADDVSCTVPSGLSTIKIGAAGDGSVPTPVYLDWIALYPTRLSAAAMESLTA